MPSSPVALWEGGTYGIVDLLPADASAHARAYTPDRPLDALGAHRLTMVEWGSSKLWNAELMTRALA